MASPAGGANSRNREERTLTKNPGLGDVKCSVSVERCREMLVFKNTSVRRGMQCLCREGQLLCLRTLISMSLKNLSGLEVNIV